MMIIIYHKIKDEKIEAVHNQYFEKRIDEYSKYEDKLRTYISFVLLKKLAKHYGYDLDNLEINRDKNGKPYLVNNEFFFSISHCCDMVAVAIDENPIGVDIECVRTVNLQIAKKFFSDRVETITNSDNPDIEFTKQWTIFESKLKYWGNIDDLRKKSMLETVSMDIVDETRYILTIASQKIIESEINILKM